MSNTLKVSLVAAVASAAAVALVSRAGPTVPLQTVPPSLAPPNCANGFSQTSVNGQPGSAQFGFSCQYQLACPAGTEYLKSIVQVSGAATGPTTATFKYSCSYLNVSTKRR